MCGIVGLANSNLTDINGMIRSLVHRGPDAQAAKFFDRLALGHTRLSILDLDQRSNQPFSSPCERYTLVFNGEIYNYKALKRLLKNKNYKFKTTSDTEVLLYWLMEKGSAGIESLDGMFAFCLFDKAENTLLLARDHIGEKPLYYAENGKSFAFCSEINPIKKLSWVDVRINPQALKNYLFFLYTPAPDTFFNGIKELAPGSTLQYDLKSNTYTTSQYFNLADVVKDEYQDNYDTSAKTFYSQFYRSVRRRLHADVPVGMYLSGGLDSNSIAAISKKILHGDISSYTMSYKKDREANEYDESSIAKRCADYYKISNNSIELKNNESPIEAANRMVDVFGVPFGNSTALVAEELARTVTKSNKVCMVGDGGDEVLAGYPRHKAIYFFKYFKIIPGFFARLLIYLLPTIPQVIIGETTKRRARQLFESIQLPISDAYLNMVGYCQYSELDDIIGKKIDAPFYTEIKQVFERYQNDPLKAAQIVDMISFVPYNLMQCADRTSMANSLELRCPFLAKHLVTSMLKQKSHNKISRKQNKPILADALRTLLPPFLFGITKKPFNPPLRYWMRNDILPIKEYFTSEKSKISKIISSDFINKEISDFERGSRDNSTFIWALLSLESWLRKNFISDPIMAD